MIKNEIQILGSSKQIFLGGFSEGCSMAIATWLKFDQQLGGIIACNGLHCTIVDWE
jgi:predicted esterase